MRGSPQQVNTLSLFRARTGARAKISCSRTRNTCHPALSIKPHHLRSELSLHDVVVDAGGTDQGMLAIAESRQTFASSSDGNWECESQSNVEQDRQSSESDTRNSQGARDVACCSQVISNSPHTMFSLTVSYYSTEKHRHEAFHEISLRPPHNTTAECLSDANAFAGQLGPYTLHIPAHLTAGAHD